MRFKNPYLIQRLRKPFKPSNEESEKATMMKKIANAFSFGGGLVNGGLSKEAMELVSKIWRYDYMGAAEFEWGAVPESLHRMGKNHKSLVTGKIKVLAEANDWSSRPVKKIKKDGLVYYVCYDLHQKDVEEWIPKFADDIKHEFRTKESVNLSQNIIGSEYHKDTVGWHDNNNDYLFFTDPEMYLGFCDLFEIKPVETDLQTAL